MFKGADDIAHLLNLSVLDNTPLVDVIGDYFKDCSKHVPEEDEWTCEEDFLDTGT